MLKAREGSPHGYDISDHAQLNPEIGTWEEFVRFADTLKSHGIGLVLDIVPNHMGASRNNPWWMDVLENGPASLYAEYFDIDWQPLEEDLQNKILLPILGNTYGAILENGELQLRFDAQQGRFWLDYYDNAVPINPSSYPIVLLHRLETLEARIGKEHSAFLEYQSIISAFEHLPVALQDSMDAKEHRSRERRVALGRLVTLVNQSDAIRQFIGENVQDFQPRLADPTNLLRLHRLLEQQSYRLSNWRVASDEINYRRFFDVNDLVAVCVEDPRVFNDTHALIMTLIERGWVQGLRIDHPDGLYDPADYFRRLQEEALKHRNISGLIDWKLGSPSLPLYVVIEKILAPFERLPDEWVIHGTTGYEFVNAVNGLFINQEHDQDFTRLYEKVLGQPIDFHELVYQSKKLIMRTSLNGELGGLAHRLIRLCKYNWSTRDFTLYNLRSALMEVVASFPVYRTYVTAEQISKKDREYIEWAVRVAKRRNLATGPGIFDFIRAVLLLEFAPEGYLSQSGALPTLSEGDSLQHDTYMSSFQKDVIRFALKFQQYTGPVMAKGMEDTSFYRYNRLLSLNEVGGEPSQFGLSVAAFHHQNIERLKRTPHTMLATSTHDTKRSEGVRTRLSVLSEMPEEWYRHVMRWRKLNRQWRRPLEEGEVAPSLDEEYLFYQTLLGIYPLYKANKDERQQLAERLKTYMVKAARESKKSTSWINPNQEYEEALTQFVHTVVTKPSTLFMEDFLSLQTWVARLGLYNALSQTLLKLTVPGVPDIYQGTELWDFTLVDPDNRRPIDYMHRQAILEDVRALWADRHTDDFPTRFSTLTQTLEDGRIKAYVITAVLSYRATHPDLFELGQYWPLEVIGTGADYIVAFARQWEHHLAITVVPRLLYTKGLRRNALPCGKRVWQDTAIVLPEEVQRELPPGSEGMHHLLDGQFLPWKHRETGATLPVAKILEHSPVGFLTL